MHLQGYDYCRIDGSTDGESRDSQVCFRGISSVTWIVLRTIFFLSLLLCGPDYVHTTIERLPVLYAMMASC